MNSTVKKLDPGEADSVKLIEGLWAELGQMYGDTGPCRFRPEDVRGNGCAFLVAYFDDEPAACGAIVPHGEGVAEVKRMFVDHAWRRKGLARAILSGLEEEARTLGYTSIKLETGSKQPGAIRLYESAGYKSIQCWGAYADDPLSHCFEKSLRVD